MLIDQSIIDARAEETIYAEIHDPQYTELLEKRYEAQKHLEQMVPKKQRDEFCQLWDDEFEYADVQYHNIELKESYKQGLYDGLEIALMLLERKK